MRNNILHLKHERGIDINLAVIKDIAASELKLVGTHDSVTVPLKDSYSAFHKQLKCFIEYAMDGEPSFPFTETVELMKIIIAGIMSRDEGGCEVMLGEIEL